MTLLGGKGATAVQTDSLVQALIVHTAQTCVPRHLFTESLFLFRNSPMALHHAMGACKQE